MGKDYSEYIPSKTELYFIQRKGNKYISMDTFRKLVKFYPEDRKIHILVDSYYEQIFRSDDIAEDERMDSEHREIHPDILTELYHLPVFVLQGLQIPGISSQCLVCIPVASENGRTDCSIRDILELEFSKIILFNIGEPKRRHKGQP